MQNFLLNPRTVWNFLKIIFLDWVRRCIAMYRFYTLRISYLAQEKLNNKRSGI